MTDKNDQEKNAKRKTRNDSSNVEFKLKTLINELSTVLILMELAKRKLNDPANPELPVYLLNRSIEKRYENIENSKIESIKLLPALVYNLMNDLADKDNDVIFVKKDGSDYSIKDEGVVFLKSEMKRLDYFIEQYQKIKKEILNE